MRHALDKKFDLRHNREQPGYKILQMNENTQWANINLSKNEVKKWCPQGQISEEKSHLRKGNNLHRERQGRAGDNNEKIVALASYI